MSAIGRGELLVRTRREDERSCAAQRARHRRGRGSGEPRQAVRARSSRRRAAAWGSACSSVARSSSDIRAACGPSRTRTGPAPRSRSRSLAAANGPGRVHARRHLVTGKAPLVSIVDDDISVRESLPPLLRQVGYAAEAFSSAEAFLASDRRRRDELPPPRRRDAGDVRPRAAGGTGAAAPDDPDHLRHGQRDRTLRPRLLALGAVECLFKPFSEAALLGALDTALAESRDDRGERGARRPSL